MHTTENVERTMTAEQIAATIAEYERLVRLNTTESYDAIGAVVDADGAEIMWEVLDTAGDLGHMPEGDIAELDWSSLSAAMEELRERFAAEREA